MAVHTSRRPFPRWVTRRGSSDRHHHNDSSRPLSLYSHSTTLREGRTGDTLGSQLWRRPRAEGRTRTANTRTGIVGPVARRQSPLARAERARAARCGYWVARLSAGGLELSLPPPLPDRPSLPFAGAAGPRFLAFRESVALNCFEQRLGSPAGLTTPAAQQKYGCASSFSGRSPLTSCQCEGRNRTLAEKVPLARNSD